MNCKDFSNFLDGLSGYELVAIASFLSFIIANKLSSDEINILGSFFLLLVKIYLPLQVIYQMIKYFKVKKSY